MAIYLGFDSSTQSLTATAIEVAANARHVLFTRTFPFDDLLPRYGTRYGVLPSSAPGVVHGPPFMWAEALDGVIGVLKRDERIDWANLRAISGSAQQHGTVYLTRTYEAQLRALRPDRPLVVQLRGVLARPTSPIWMDTSTTAECDEIERQLGGPQAVARLTGSRCYERFPAPQIRKFAKEAPDSYARTARIHLVSSWLASLLAGRDAPVDYGDGSGMNLMSLSSRRWSPAALAATAAELDAKLPDLAESSTVIGPLAPYWTGRYGLPPALVAAWSGDNPNSLIGTGLVSTQAIAVSLGTSDTVFRPMDSPDPAADGTGHIFASPAGGYMGMTVFQNGALARERVRARYALDWDGFSAALRATPAGNHGAMMLPWFEPEITPSVRHAGVVTQDLDPADAAANVRALIEAQAMAMARHVRWMGSRPEVIRATGGASVNREILQVIADVFGAPVVRLEAANSAALGAALRAFHAAERAAGRLLPWPEVVDGFTEPVADLRIDPRTESTALYSEHLTRYARLEIAALHERRD